MTRLNKTPLTIRAKRGTEAQITATSPAPYQLEGEIAYATDTKQYYVSDGTRFLRVVTADVNGNVGIGTDSPTARLHLPAGTATAGTAPLKFTSGALLTAEESGVIEYLSDRFYIRDNVGLSVYGSVGIGVASPIKKFVVSAAVQDFCIVASSPLTFGQWTGFGIRAWEGISGSIKSGFVHQRTETTYGRGSIHLLNNNDVNDSNADLTDAVLTITNTGKVGISDTSPTAWLNLPAGTAAANTAPLKFTSGTLLGTPEAGVLEYDGCRLYMTNVATQRALDRTSDVAVETVTVADEADETVLWTGAMPADSLCAGNLFKFHCDGLVSNNGNHSDNDFTIRVRLGSITGTIMASLTPTTKAMTDEHWHIVANATQRTIGASGSRAIHLHLEVGDADEELVIAVATVDTTSVLDVVITVDWVTAHANNNIRLYQGFMEYKN